MFIDRVKIMVKAGDGGDGCSAFRREKFIPKGGPNGGDGGRGGDVFFQGDARLKTLLDFTRKPNYTAGRGQDGMGNNSFGKDGADLALRVPVGTTVYKDGLVFADVLKDGERVLLSEGGRGGRGNVHFKSSTRQAPRIAERGEPSDPIEIELRLRLIADVGFVGFPNGGKSTLLSRLTRAHPKIANYPFTTLFPNLGVTIYGDREIVFADVPGLIEGSHTGKGLGHQFLQHLDRTRILVHVVDPHGFNGVSPRAGLRVINDELKRYSKTLAGKPQIIVVNKQDLTDADLVYQALKKANPKKLVLPLSGVTGAGLDKLLKEVDKMLRHAPEPPPFDSLVAPTETVRVQLEPDFWIEMDNDRYVVKGKKIEKLIRMTPFHLPEAVERTQHILRKLGVEKALQKKGAVYGAKVVIADYEFDFEPDSTFDTAR